MSRTAPPAEEQPLFLPCPGGERIFAVLHRAQDGPGELIVYCAPILEEKLNAHRIGVTFARVAAKRGYHVLRFDYVGDGESTGDFVDASVDTRVRDTMAAATWAREAVGAPLVHLLGLRFGALIGLLVAERSPEVARVVAWSPVLQGKAYLHAALRANLTSQLATHKRVLQDRAALVAGILAGSPAEIEGWELGAALYESASLVDLCARPLSGRAPVLAIQIARKPVGTDPLAAFRAVNRPDRVQTVAVAELEFWNPQTVAYPPCRQLFDRTLDWLGEGSA